MVTGCLNAVMTADMAANVYCTQGSYSTSVGASGGTHAGGGALDFSRFRRDGREWNWNELCTIALCLRQVGFAAWPRERIAGTWERHVHAEAIGCGDASQAAKNQWTAYKNRRDGLAGNAADPLTHYDITWEDFHAAHPYVLEDIMASLADVEAVVARHTDGIVEAVAAKVLSMLRSEGVSGAADWGSSQRADGSWPIGAYARTVTTEEVGKLLDVTGLAKVPQQIADLEAQLKPYIDGPEAPATSDTPEISPH
jgi:hypothetical protein